MPTEGAPLGGRSAARRPWSPATCCRGQRRQRHRRRCRHASGTQRQCRRRRARPPPSPTSRRRRAGRPRQGRPRQTGGRQRRPRRPSSGRPPRPRPPGGPPCGPWSPTLSRCRPHWVRCRPPSWVQATLQGQTWPSLQRLTPHRRWRHPQRPHPTLPPPSGGAVPWLRPCHLPACPPLRSLRWRPSVGSHLCGGATAYGGWGASAVCAGRR